MKRSTSLVALGLSFLAMPAVATAPIKSSVQGKSAYADFLDVIEVCGENQHSSSVTVGFNEDQYKAGGGSGRFVFASMVYGNPCIESSPFVSIYGHTEVQSAGLVYADSSTVDSKLRKGRIDATFPVQLSTGQLCQATIKVDVLSSSDKPSHNASAIHQWKYGAFKLLNVSTVQPAVATGSITVGPLQHTDGSTVPCPLPEGAPTEWAVGNVTWNGTTPSTLLGESKTATFERVQ